MKKTKKGFTLIELLAVMAIISILATLTIAMTKSARMKARDAKRLSDLEQIRLTLQLYFDDQRPNNHFPIVTGVGAESGGAGVAATNWVNLFSPTTGLGKYISTVPRDPINTSTGGGPWSPNVYTYYYLSDAVGSKYELITRLEDPGHPNRCAKMKWISELTGPWCPTPGAGDQIYSDH